MSIPIELIATILAVALTAIIGLQGWILLELVRIKIRLARYEDVEKRVRRQGMRLQHVEKYCGIEAPDLEEA